MNRLHRWLLAALVLVGAFVLTSCDEPVTASRVDPTFGVDGVLAIPTTPPSPARRPTCSSAGPAR